MSKLSLEALKMRAEAVASEDLLATISGGTENSCHDNTPTWTVDYTCDENPCPSNSEGIQLPSNFSLADLLRLLGTGRL